jgi:hypothetical protein
LPLAADGRATEFFSRLVYAFNVLLFLFLYLEVH